MCLREDFQFSSIIWLLFLPFKSENSNFAASLSYLSDLTLKCYCFLLFHRTQCLSISCPFYWLAIRFIVKLYLSHVFVAFDVRWVLLWGNMLCRRIQLKRQMKLWLGSLDPLGHGDSQKVSAQFFFYFNKVILA